MCRCTQYSWIQTALPNSALPLALALKQLVLDQDFSILAILIFQTRRFFVVGGCPDHSRILAASLAYTQKRPIASFPSAQLQQVKMFPDTAKNTWEATLQPTLGTAVFKEYHLGSLTLPFYFNNKRKDSFLAPSSHLPNLIIWWKAIIHLESYQQTTFG